MTGKTDTTKSRSSSFAGLSSPDNRAAGYRVVLVVPTSSDLPGAHGEVLAAMEYGDRITAVQHPVTAQAVLHTLDEIGEQRNVVWVFSAHARLSGDDAWESSIQLDDSELATSTIATYAKLYRPVLIYINSCQSERIAKLICEYAGIDGICTEVDVPDELAYTTEKIFLKQLFATGDIKKAYDQSRPANNTSYVYISGYRDGSAMAQRIETDSVDLKTIYMKVEALDRAIRGDDYGSDGLIAEFRQFKSDLLRYMDERRGWERSVENRLAKIELEQQELIYWKSQVQLLSQPKALTASSYVQILVFLSMLVTLQIMVVWITVNFFR